MIPVNRGATWMDANYVLNKDVPDKMIYVLLVALMKSHPSISWRANNHSDGTMKDGNWFVAGMHLPTGDISFYLPSSWWFHLDYALIDVSNRAPLLDIENDKTGSDIVFSRLYEWASKGKLETK